MGSRRFFYLLPAPERRLEFSRVLSTLIDGGFELDPDAFCSRQDETGVVVSTRRVDLGDRPFDRVLGLLDTSERLDVLLCSAKLALSCSFGSPHENPVCFLNTLHKHWCELPQEARLDFERLLVAVADSSGAEFILVIDDPSDDFIGRLQLVDDEWLVDQYLPDGSKQEIASVWAAPNARARLEIPGLTNTGRLIGSFQELAE